ncbi:MAG: peptidoglycan-binding protein [Candidatus Taylorbacteria bacterium]|nr:peptidoglycan-binding protein [Candidatus Taylorbacteria bacterium]
MNKKTLFLTLLATSMFLGAYQAEAFFHRRKKPPIEEQKPRQIVNVTDKKLERTLRFGMSGEDVRLLQELLARDPEVYPEAIITGRFGPLTEKAVKKFQKKHGIDTIGIVGPATRARLVVIFLTNDDAPLPADIIRRINLLVSGTTTPPNGTTTPPITGTTTPGGGRGETKVEICHIPPGNPAAKHTVVIGLPAVRAHLRHGDTVGGCGGAATTTPPAGDVTAPTISNLTASSTGSTGATITWATDEPATSDVWYGTTTPFQVTVGTAHASADGLVLSHSVSLTGLTASTTYQFLANSKDAAGNSATSTVQSLTTP